MNFKLSSVATNNLQLEKFIYRMASQKNYCPEGRFLVSSNAVKSQADMWVMTPTSHLKGSTKNATPAPTPLSIPQTMPIVDNEDMSTAKYLRQVLVSSPSDLEEKEIEVLQETISVLKKDLSAAGAEIAVLRLDLTDAKPYSNALENLIKLKKYLIGSLQKSAYILLIFSSY